MKKLINRFRKWLIVKLGGYVVPYGEIRHYSLNPIEICASFRQHRDDYDVPEEYVREHLVKLLVQEIVKNNLYRIESRTDYSLCAQVHKMKMFVVDPKEFH